MILIIDGHVADLMTFLGVFCVLSAGQGEGVTTGLKKETDNMKTNNMAL